MTLLADNLPLGIRRTETGEFYEVGVTLGGQFFAIAALKAPEVDLVIGEAHAEAAKAADKAGPPVEPVTSQAPPAEQPGETAAQPEPPAAEQQAGFQPPAPPPQ